MRTSPRLQAVAAHCELCPVNSAHVLLDLASAAARLFHAPDGTAFADIIVDSHRETWPLRSSRFRAWLRQQYYERTWDAPSPAALNAALNVLEAQAQFDGPERTVSVRIAEHGGSIYLDLADEFWRCVEVSPRGWRIAADPPVRFRRPAGMLALPLPVRGGAIELLAPLLNLPGQDQFVLVVSWLMGALRAGGPYPLLAVAGEQGSAKTVLSKMLRALVDPHVAPVRALPREERELFIAAHNSHVMAFDNLTGLPPWLSDTLCRLTSGGAFAVRQLYTDQNEVMFTAVRPVILNGIEEVVTRPDLADRAVLLTLDPITDQQRRPEQALWQAFERARPQILAALLDRAVQGLQALPYVRLERLPRMADFALWVAACETASWAPGTFEAAYWSNRRSAIEDVIDADPVAACVRHLMAETSEWTGSASDLLRAGLALEEAAPYRGRTDWPKTPRALAGRLRRAQTFLRTLGVEIRFAREGRIGARMIKIHAPTERTPTTPSVPSATVGVDLAREPGISGSGDGVQTGRRC
jgi:hypothetical protein